jgi:hypothetical protein
MALSESKFNMWRATVYLVMVDGKITKEESQWLKDYLFKAKFSEEQKKIIQEDINSHSTKFSEIYSKITHPPDRATLVHFANMIFKRDGEFHSTEKEFLEKLQKSVMSKVDMESALDGLTKVTYQKEEDKDRYQKAFDFVDQFTLFDN